MGAEMTRWYIIPLSLATIAASMTLSPAADKAVPIYKAPVPATIEYGNIYFGVDATSHKSLAGYAGVLYAPFGMHQSGIRLSAFGLLGRYEYHSDPDTITGRFGSVDALVGWSHVTNNGAYTLSVGANFQDHRLRPDDPNNPVRGSEFGFKVQGDFWVNPTPATLLVGLASYSTAFDTYYALGRAGYDFTRQGIYFGPEVGALGNDRTDQVRVGAHLSGIKLGPGKLTISSGWMHERNEGDGWYGTATLDFPF
jgi:hypothetical protein